MTSDTSTQLPSPGAIDDATLLAALKSLYEAADTSNRHERYIQGSLSALFDMWLDFSSREIRRNHPNPLSRCGLKCFSQTDEDGITLEIVRRLGISQGLYAEFGVGDGMENNSLILAAAGWRGFWVGGQNLAFKQVNSKKHLFIQDWITDQNIDDHVEKGCAHLGSRDLDVVSLDLDGNDIYFVDTLLSGGLKPKLFMVEYNGKFPPPVRFQIPYDPQHRWNRDDFFGASLCSFVDLFQGFGYSLVACNAHSGSNAFFVRNEFMDRFADVPKDIGQIYCAPRYILHRRFGHTASPRVIEQILAD